eukprot:4126223-Amphidinium_carterae.2
MYRGIGISFDDLRAVATSRLPRLSSPCCLFSSVDLDRSAWNETTKDVERGFSAGPYRLMGSMDSLGCGFLFVALGYIAANQRS